MVAGRSTRSLARITADIVEFEIYFKDVLIGHSSLENGDPPMGVAFGRFFPLPAYESHLDQMERAHLSVRVPGGVTLENEGGVNIEDPRPDLGIEAIEVAIYGIGYPLYGQMFPEHVDAYDKQFRDAG